MKSVRNRFALTTALIVLFTAVVIGGISVLDKKYTKKESLGTNLGLECRVKAAELDKLLSDTQASVEAAAKAAGELLAAGCDAENVGKTTALIAENTEATAVYFISDNDSALYAREAAAKDLEKKSDITLSEYDNKDAKGLVWSAPHENSDIGQTVISCAFPVHNGSKRVGIIGADIDFQRFFERADTVLDGGGFVMLANSDGKLLTESSLTDDEAEIFASSVSVGRQAGELFACNVSGKSHTFCLGELSGNMRLVYAVPANEISARASKPLALSGHILVVVMLTIGGAVAAAVVTDRHVIRPLREMNSAVRKISDGEFDTDISWRSKDEFGLFADALRKERDSFRKNSSQINDIAYRDPLTGVGNSAAYREAVMKLNGKIRKSIPKFTVIVFDVNNLKKVNDSYGHNFGDILITSASKLIRETFEPNGIYRIGGDEFCVILENDNAAMYNELLNDFAKNVERFNNSAQARLPVSVASGYSQYTSDDDNYMSVFRRADSDMYHNKEEMKKAMGDGLPEKRHTDLFKSIG